MADGDRAAVRIDARVLEVDAHQLEAAEHLAGEGLVDLDDIHVPERQAGALKRARNGIRRPDAHDARLDAGARSEERRVGKEGRWRGGPEPYEKRRRRAREQ